MSVMSNTIFYFAYGSNMSSARLQARVGSARNIGVGGLMGHCLEFHMLSRIDGSAECDVYATGCVADVVHGVLFRLDARELPVLDRYEGRGIAYERVMHEIERPDGRCVYAHTYRALRTETGTLPFDGCKANVLNGAREHGLPAAYWAHLERVPVVRDGDATRRARELAIYD